MAFFSIYQCVASILCVKIKLKKNDCEKINLECKDYTINHINKTTIKVRFIKQYNWMQEHVISITQNLIPQYHTIPCNI